MGRIRASFDEWQAYYQRADRERMQYGDPFERHIRNRRLRNAIFNVCVSLALIGITGAITALALSWLGER